MGMLSNFIAGGTKVGEELLREQIRADAELQKLARIDEINAARAETIRQQTADRVKGYMAPVTSTVPGVAAAPGAFEYEGEDGPAGNPVATQDTTTTRPATLREGAMNAATAGDLVPFTAFDSAAHKDDQVAASKERADNILRASLYGTDSRERVAANREDTKLELAFDKDGNRYATGGKGADHFNAIINGVKAEIAHAERRLGRYDDQLREARKDLTSYDTKEEKAKALADIQKKIDDTEAFIIKRNAEKNAMGADDLSKFAATPKGMVSAATPKVGADSALPPAAASDAFKKAIEQLNAMSKK